ncbi:SDR family NAD(P)-dependent oxidoreductase [Variovorax terrae]|uniref:SDR family oxidoreductase n=1 Tax=Variovorax terrae TaxID=2923278 RepID=A0A9X2AQI8_9BURK|nr:SDR family oxidoreductase [Variovorax terrae]MCJ0766055.1 SDR family oxidoreductase [Variovorax terrae]
MLLNHKTAVIHGAGGAIGGAVARAFARAGARVFLAGRTPAKLDAVARDIRAAGGTAETAVVEALDEQAVERHADAVAAQAGGIDIALNAVGVFHVQGTPFARLSLEDYAYPVTVYTRTNFITAKAAARHMAKRGSGVVLMLTTPASRMPGPGFLGHSVACAGVEAMTRHLAGELGPDGIRVLCLRSHAIPEATAPALGSHCRDVFRQVAEPAGMSIGDMLAGAATGTLLKRLPTLDQVAATAVFLASEQAGAMTGAIANLTCGMSLD